MRGSQSVVIIDVIVMSHFVGIYCNRNFSLILHTILTTSSASSSPSAPLEESGFANPVRL